MNKRRKWTTEEKFNIVLEALRGENSIQDICRKYGLSQTVFYRWRDKFLEGALKNLQSSQNSKSSSSEQARIRELERILGRKTMEIEILKKSLELM